MKEIIEKEKEAIKNLYEEKKEINELNEKAASLQEEMKKIDEKLENIEDRESGFYQDLKEEKETKNSDFTEILNQRLRKEQVLKNHFDSKKLEIIVSIQEKMKLIDDNRKNQITEKLDDLKKEKENIEKELKLNDVTKAEFLKLTSNEEKMAVKRAKERYLINKNRLKEILPKIEILELLEGKDSKDRYLELQELLKEVKEKFTIENLDNFYKEVKEKEETDKDAEIENPEEKEDTIIKQDETIEKPAKKEDTIIKQDEVIEQPAKKENTIIKQDEVIKKPEKQENTIKKQDETIEKPEEKKDETKTNPVATPSMQPKANKTIQKPVVKKEDNTQSDNDKTELKDDKKEIKVDGPIRIFYSAKYDKYEIMDPETGDFLLIRRRKELRGKYAKYEKGFAEFVKNEYGASLLKSRNVDLDILTLLNIYDKTYGTSKEEEYLEACIGEEKEKEDRQKQMQEIGIDIEYNLKGLYNKKQKDSEYEEEDIFTKEERESILKKANIAKDKGIATVKKGIYVTIREKIDNIVNRLKSTKLLSSGEEESRKQKIEKEEEQTTYDDKLEENEKFVEKAIKESKETTKKKVEETAKKKLEEMKEKAEEKYKEMKELEKEAEKAVFEDYKEGYKTGIAAGLVVSETDEPAGGFIAGASKIWTGPYGDKNKEESAHKEFSKSLNTEKTEVEKGIDDIVEKRLKENKSKHTDKGDGER